MSGVNSDASSGLASIDTHSSSAHGSRKKKRTIESKVNKKRRKLFDLILSCVSDEKKSAPAQQQCQKFDVYLLENYFAYAH
jgi:hypothetical protein